MECSPADHSSSDQGKESFHLIQPGTAGGSEMVVESRALFRFQPTLYLGAFVAAVVVHNQVDFLVGRQILFQVIQEADEFTTAMSVLARTDDFAIEDIKSGE